MDINIWLAIGAIISAVAAVITALASRRGTQANVLKSFGEGYDNLLPHLNKRINELEKSDKDKTGQLHVQQEMINKLQEQQKEQERRDKERKEAIEAAINQLKDTIAILETAK